MSFVGFHDIGETVATPHALGVVTGEIRIDEITGRRFTFFADPDGLPLDLHEIPDEHSSQPSTELPSL